MVLGPQPVKLTHNCTRKYVVAHQLAHVMGLQHEHMRPDRDKYIDILWDNVEPGTEYAFDKLPESDFYAIGPYDYLSIMHNI